MIILKGLEKMKYLAELTSHQIFLLKGMLRSKEWRIFKEYNKELVMSYLNTVESKDFLRGLKFSASKFEEDIEREINDKH